jgi:hypothetical protein
VVIFSVRSDIINIMLSVNFFCNISSYDIFAYTTKNYSIDILCENSTSTMSGERNVKILIDKSPRFSLTSPLSQEREKSSRPVFTMCGEPCKYVPSLVNFIETKAKKSPTLPGLVSPDLVLKRIWNPTDFQGHRSKSPGQIFTT